MALAMYPLAALAQSPTTSAPTTQPIAERITASMPARPAASAPASSATTLPALPDNVADIVLGQVDMGYPFPNRTDARGIGGPMDVAVDTSVEPYRLYVIDAGNHRVLGYKMPLPDRRPVEATLVIGQANLYGGFFNERKAERSTMLYPSGLAVDPKGNLYVSDLGYHRILQFDRPFETDTIADRVFGQQDDFAGLGPNRGGVTARTLAFPNGLCVDPLTGNLWVADGGNNRVLCFHDPLTSDTTADYLIGQTDFQILLANQGGLSAASLSAPYWVSVFGKQLVVCDRGNHRVLIYDDPLATDKVADHVFGQNGSFKTGESGCSPQRLLYPTAVQVDAAHPPGVLLVSDSGNNRVLAFPMPVSKTLQTQAASDPLLSAITTPRGGADQPVALWGQGQNLHSAEPNAGGIGPASLAHPRGMALAPDGMLWIVDRENHRVLGYQSGKPSDRIADVVIGQLDTQHSTFNFVDGQGLDKPRDVALDRTVNPPRLYLCDWYNNRILGYSSIADLGPDRRPDIILGQPDCYGNDPGPGRRGLNTPSALAVDGKGGLFVTDRDNNRVLWFENPFTTDTLADRVFGQSDFDSTEPNPGGISARTLRRPEGLTLDAEGNLFVSDTRNHRVLRYDGGINGDGVADAVWGQSGSFEQGTEYGGEKVQRNTFSYPFGVKIDRAGRMLVADTSNHRVLMFNLRGANPRDAVKVFGQEGDFTSSKENRGGCSPRSLSGPEGLAFHGLGLFISDTANGRVLFYRDYASAIDTAEAIYGQSGSFTAYQQSEVIADPRTLWFPSGIEVDDHGSLYVADRDQCRMLIYQVDR